MGCPVNGLGEARHADYAILGGRGCGSVYAQGEVVAARVPEDKLVEELVLLVRRQVTPLGR